MIDIYDFLQKDQTDDQREALMLRKYEKVEGAGFDLVARAMVQGADVEARGDARSVIAAARVLASVATPDNIGARVIITTDSGRGFGLFRGE